MGAIPGAVPGNVEAPLEALEIDLLLEAVRRHFGFDLRGYEQTGLRRKLHALMRERGCATVSALQAQVLHQSQAGAALLRAVGATPAQLFDDPLEARQLRAVLAGLNGWPLPKVWLADCAGAEQAWTLAILLWEEGLHARTEIFATVGNDQLLADAAQAGVALDRLGQCEQRYLRSGGGAQFSAYFEISDGRAMLLPELRRRITWAQYNLVTDASFNEFQLIVCRRALSEFGPLLRQRVLQLFHDSLARFGMLAIDRVLEDGSALALHYRCIQSQPPWYKRIS